MKKGTKILLSLISLLLLAIFLITIQSKNVAAENAPQPAYPFGLNPEKIQDLPQTPEEASNVTTTYLKQEWTKILDKTQAGKVILKISDFLTYLNFFWKPVFGIEYSLSWAFIFSIAIWAILFYLVFGPLTAITKNKIVSIIGGFCIASLVGTAGIIKKAVDLLGFVIANTWIAWISLVIAILIMFLIGALSGQLKAYLKKQKEQAEKDKTERAQKIIQTQGKIAEKELESYND
jgi:hypothetical protein